MDLSLGELRTIQILAARHMFPSLVDEPTHALETKDVQNLYLKAGDELVRLIREIPAKIERMEMDKK